MSVATTAITGDISRRKRTRRFKLVFTANYATGGQLLDFSAVLNPSFLESATPGWFPAPSVDDFKIERMPAGYTGEIVAGSGSTPANGIALKFFSVPGTELAAGAYSAAVLADYGIISLTTSTFAG